MKHKLIIRFHAFINELFIQFTLVCNHAWFQPMIASTHMFGRVVAAIVFGYIADNCGRKKALLFGTFLSLAGNLLNLYIPSFIVLLLGRLMVGMADFALTSLSLILG